MTIQEYIVAAIMAIWFVGCLAVVFYVLFHTIEEMKK